LNTKVTVNIYVIQLFSVSGEEAWPPGCNLRYCCGDNLSNTDRAIVNMLEPGQEADISVDMESPVTTGVYQSQWRMSTPTGLFFGGKVFRLILDSF
jgi:next-to-BRCA1 protein 1